MRREFGRDEPLKGYEKVRNRRREDFRLANVDLELASEESIQPLIVELGDWIYAFYLGGEVGDGKQANLEVMYYPSFDDDIYQSYNDNEDLVGGTDCLISAFCEMIENLSPESRRIWEKCHRKEFDVGFECGNTRKSFHTQIRAETLKRVARLGATILITVYPHLNYEFRKKK